MNQPSRMKTPMKNKSALLFCSLCLTMPALRAADWPHWRGQNFDGISTERVVESGSPSILWKAQLGIGFSSFSVVGGRVYTMGHADGKDTVWCLDAKSGKVVWSHSYDADLGDKYYEGGTSCTPTVDGDQVFVLSRWGDVFCLNAATGKVVWTKNPRQDEDLRIPDWGYGGSPLVSGNTILLNMGESGIALEKSTGKTLWKSPNKDAGYSTPVPYDAGGTKAAVLGSGRAYVAVDIATGKVLWSHDWRTSYGVNAADAIVKGSEVFISSGYEKGAALLKVGDSAPAVVWQSKVMRNQMSPSVLVDGYLYGIDGNESKKPALKCIEWASGTEKWAYPEAGCGSVTVAGDQLVVLSDAGELAIGKISPAGFKPGAKAQVLSGRCWTVPVVANGQLYARNAEGAMVFVNVAAK